MSSPSGSPALLPAGRSRWVWLAVAAALGLWLIVLLLSPGDGAGEALESEPSEGAAPRNETFDSPAAEAFTKRHPVKSSRPLPSFPVRSNEGQSK